MPTALRNLKIRRVALCGKGANQEAFVTLYKRDTEGEEPSMDDKDLEKVSESIFQRLAKLFKRQDTVEGAPTPDAEADAVAKRHADELAEREKNLAAREAEIKKRDDEIATLKQAEERRVYIAKAEKLPGFGKAEAFGPILHKISQALTAEEFTILEKQLAGAQGQIDTSKLFTELGVAGETEILKPNDQLAQMAAQMVAKAEGKLTPAQAYTAALQTPEGRKLYAAHVAEKERA